jgi:hypothetical protein
MTGISEIAYGLLTQLAANPNAWLDMLLLRHLPNGVLDTETLYAEMDVLVAGGWAEEANHDPNQDCQNCCPHAYWHITPQGIAAIHHLNGLQMLAV